MNRRRASKLLRRCRNRGRPFSGISVGDVQVTADAASGIETARSSTGSPKERENLHGDAKGKRTSGYNRKTEVPMRRLGAHCLVVAMKRVLPVQPRGWVTTLDRVNGVGSTGSGRILIINGTRQPSHGGTSRTTPEYHVRICEGSGVQLPASTRQRDPGRASKLDCREW